MTLLRWRRSDRAAIDRAATATSGAAPVAGPGTFSAPVPATGGPPERSTTMPDRPPTRAELDRLERERVQRLAAASRRREVAVHRLDLDAAVAADAEVAALVRLAPMIEDLAERRSVASPAAVAPFLRMRR